MRALTSTLLAAQRAASGTPFVRVQLHDRDVGVVRLRWERWYAGLETAGPSAVATPADGSLLRARIDVATAMLSYQRVASPGPASVYSGWTALGNVAVAPRIALAAAGTRALLAVGRIDDAIAVLDAMRVGGELSPRLEADRCRELAHAWERKGEAAYADDYRDRARLVAR